MIRTANEQDARSYLSFAAVVLAVVLLAASFLWTMTPAPEAAKVSSPVEVVCMEDMPCWECSANDNRPCVDGVLVK